VARALLSWAIATAIVAVVVPLAIGARPYAVLSGSMEPALCAGHLAVVRPVALEDVERGDMVACRCWVMRLRR
jgi:signal peptidase